MGVKDPSDGFKWHVCAERVISAPAVDMWRAISLPSGLELGHPYCASNPVLAWPGPDARDEVHYLNGLVYERRFRSWVEGDGYDLEIGRRGGRQSLVSWRIVPLDSDRCALRITVCPCVLQELPTVIRWMPYSLWLRPRLRSYLDSVVRGFEWFVVRREPVPKNAFGTHRWFS